MWGELFDLLVLKELQLRSGKGGTCMEKFSFQIMMKERSTCNLLWEAYPPPSIFCDIRLSGMGLLYNVYQYNYM